MERSFKLNGIGYVRFDQRQKKDKDAVNLFKTSNEIQVFMLHSQSQSYSHQFWRWMADSTVLDLV